MLLQSVLNVLLCAVIFEQCFAYFNLEKQDDCFCQLSGKIDECTCNIDTVDHFNNVKIFPRLRSLLVKDYFRFYKVNLKRPCPFWTDDSRCAIRYCHVESCEEDDIPVGIKGASFTQETNGDGKEKYLRKANEDCSSHHGELDYLNKTISKKAQKNMELWDAYDDALDNFCDIDENDQEAEYVDLLLNPERYTGYAGPSAKRIWQSIYLENCFRPKKSFSFNPYIQSAKLNELCLEERVFYRAISGLHASINTHLCANYLLSDSKGMDLIDPDGKWGPNLEEFVKRFSPETTNGEGPNWLRNLYFVYLVELRALAKAAPYLEREEYYTGNEPEDWDTQMAVKDLLSVVKQFPEHFDETTMFRNSEQAEKLKYEFKQHFRNITRIMDCVGCDKCRLWGKLQTQGLGTALKILFNGKFDHIKDGSSIHVNDKKNFQLHRNEVVSLMNALGRLSTSIYKIDDFRQMLR
ncbi:ero1-like protein isoform X2 [Anoplophora glabripennis]|uniref:ero1-like protein isoform X2 n=1 Tax=Anoplophora glabripennis TaxID=217634 RepID=UPI00087443E5|nr:ero1-like protein isoform X2 [Anoplophora glabripennis]